MPKITTMLQVHPIYCSWLRCGRCVLRERGESAKYMKTASRHQVRWGGCEISCDLEKRSRLRERVWIVSCYWMSYGARGGEGRGGIGWLVFIAMCVCVHTVCCVCAFSHKAITSHRYRHSQCPFSALHTQFWSQSLAWRRASQSWRGRDHKKGDCHHTPQHSTDATCPKLCSQSQTHRKLYT